VAKRKRKEKRENRAKSKESKEQKKKKKKKMETNRVEIPWLGVFGKKKDGAEKDLGMKRLLLNGLDIRRS